MLLEEDLPDLTKLGGIKYTKSIIRKQSIIQKSFQNSDWWATKMF
jgi:hypothetical protein